MPFGLKNAYLEFQNIIDEIFNLYNHFIIVYIDDVLVYSRNLDEHFKQSKAFLNTVKQVGLVVSAKKMKLF